MSSCFLCDTSYTLTPNNGYNVTYAEGKNQFYYMKFMPIIVGSTGTGVDDQQHKNNSKQNYVSYRVKKIEFRSSVYEILEDDFHNYPSYKPSYILIFKVPFRNPVFDYTFSIMSNFMLYSEPESVLNYGVYKRRYDVLPGSTYKPKLRSPDQFNLIVDKPFIVGPNDYVGVLYMFCVPCKISSSAKVWFDVV